MSIDELVGKIETLDEGKYDVVYYEYHPRKKRWTIELKLKETGEDGT